MLARLWKRTDTEAETAPEPMPQTVVVNPRALPASPTDALKPCRKRRSKRVQVCRLYPKPPPKTQVHARALLAFIQEECPQFIGGYVPRPDLERFYRRDLCAREGWEPFHWTGIARQLGEITHKKPVRDAGERFVGYRIPKA